MTHPTPATLAARERLMIAEARGMAAQWADEDGAFAIAAGIRQGSCDPHWRVQWALSALRRGAELQREGKL